MIAAFLSIAESWNLLEQPMTFLQSKEVSALYDFDAAFNG